MYKSNKISVVVPCYNEETQIAKVLQTIPDYVDCIVTIDDHSSDKTVDVIESFIKTDARIVLIRVPESPLPS